MTFLPVVHPAILAVVAVLLVAIAVWALVRSPSRGERIRWIPRVLLVVACALLALRPGIPAATSAQTLAVPVDVYLVVDSTTSITAEDWGDGEPRLEGVRDDVEAIVTEYPGARFALITSDNVATQRLPLTTDSNAVLSALEVLRPPTTSYARGSDIGAAAPVLADALERSGDAERSTLVFYFGDGEQTADSVPQRFTEAADLVDGGAVFGYGTADGGPMLVVDGYAPGTMPPTYLTENGQTALSIIDEANLDAIATDLGVPYEHRSAGSAPALPAPPDPTTTLADDGTLSARTELSWVIALVIAALLAWETANLAWSLRRTAREVRP